MALSVEISIAMIIDLWRQASEAAITEDVAKKYFSSAVIHVETLDYRKENVYTITNYRVEFTSVPSDISYLLYVYKALEMLARAVLSDDVNDSNLGISWRSGMETISTATAGRIKQDLYKEFSSQYKAALVTANTSSHTPERIDLYGGFGTRS